MKDNRITKYKILNFESAEVINTLNNKNTLKRDIRIRNKNGELNLDKFTGYLDLSLDVEKLEEVYKYHNKSYEDKFIYNVEGYDVTTSLINVEFNKKIYEYNVHNNPRGRLYIKFGYNLDDILLDDHICIEEEDGKKELIAIEIPYYSKDPKNLDIDKYIRVKNPVGEALLAPYFAYNKEKGCYCLAEVENKGYLEENRPNMILNVKELRELLYKDGFYCDGKHYVRYKRSAGSSREGHCLFIQENLYEDMMEWSRCGLDENKINDLASWEAYISLTLSSIIDKITIPKAAILFVHDKNSVFKEDVIAVESKGEQDILAEQKEKEITNKIWDGEALLDESIFKENGYQKYGMMLLRNKFFKTCAFNTKLSTWFKDNNITKISQLNGFTTARKVEEIKLVVTDSSLKYIKMSGVDINDKDAYEETVKTWLKNIDKQFGLVKTEKATNNMEGQMVYTNYQMINTLQLSSEEVKNLIAPSIAYIENIKGSPMFMRHYLKYKLDNDNLYEKGYDFEEDDPNLDILNYRNKIIMDMLNLNDNFVGTFFYQDFQHTVTQAIKNKIKNGRLLVHGTYATLFGNGAELLKAIIDKDYIVKDSELEGSNIYSKLFEDDQDILCARSPHVTMGNLLVSKNKRVEFYDKYFNLSNEIVCVNAINHNIQQRLNGCDYDSDTMLITDNKIMLESAKKNYNKFLVPTCFIDTASKEYEKNYKGKADLDYLIASNNIGKIINLSQLLNCKYWDAINRGKDSEDVSELYKDICVLAVASGTEIDKAKRIYNINTNRICKLLNNKYKIKEKEEPAFFKYIQKKSVNRHPDKIENGYITAMEILFKNMQEENVCKDRIKVYKEKKPRSIKMASLVAQQMYTVGNNDYKYKGDILNIINDANNKIYRLNASMVYKTDKEKQVSREKQAHIIMKVFKEVSQKIKNENIVYLLLKELDLDKNSKYNIPKIRFLLLGAICCDSNHLFYKMVEKNRDCFMYELVPALRKSPETIEIFDIPYQKDLVKYPQ